jgi:hypothetical protein
MLPLPLLLLLSPLLPHLLLLDVAPVYRHVAPIAKRPT